MARVISVELDTSVELDEGFSADEDATLDRFLRKVEVEYNLTASIVKKVGPAGGAPVILYSGKAGDVERMVFDHWTAPDDTHLERLQEVAFLVHGEE